MALLAVEDFPPVAVAKSVEPADLDFVAVGKMADSPDLIEAFARLSAYPVRFLAARARGRCSYRPVVTVGVALGSADVALGGAFPVVLVCVG